MGVLSPNVDPTGAFCVTAITSASSSDRSWQKLSWNLSCLIQTYPSESGSTFSAAAAQQILFSLISAESNALQFDFTGPNGYVGFRGKTAGNALQPNVADRLTLPFAGTYTVAVHDGTGGYAFQVDQMGQTDLTPNTPQPITLAGAQEALGVMIRCSGRALRLPDIEKAVCAVFGLDQETLQSSRRSKQLSQPRILPVQGHQSVMGSVFDDSAAMQKDDPVCISGRGGPMGHENGRPVLENAAEMAKNALLRD